MTDHSTKELAVSARQKALALCTFAESMLKENPGTSLKTALVAFVATSGTDGAPEIPADMNWDELFLSIVWSAVAEEEGIDPHDATQEMFNAVYDEVMKALTVWVSRLAPDANIGNGQGTAQ